jgi:HK97 family phage prohead protease
MVAASYKSIPAEIKADVGGFEAYCAVTEQIDRANEIIARGAFKRHIPRFRQSGLVLHNHQQGEIIASIEDTFEDDRGLFIRARYHSTPRAQELRTIMRERAQRGQTSEMSIGYFIHADAPDRKSRARRLLDVEVFEASVVNTACQPLALVASASVKGAPMSQLALQPTPSSWSLSPGEMFTSSPEYRFRKSAVVAIDLKQLDLSTIGSPAVISRGSRPTTLVDLVSEVVVSESSVSYSVFSLSGDIAAPTPAGGIKPPIAATVVSAITPIDTIAGWIRLSRAAVDDARQLKEAIDTALVAAVRRAEEAEILSGAHGILSDPGIQSIVSSTMPAALLEGQRRVYEVGLTPDGFAIHPQTWEAWRLSATGDRGYDPISQQFFQMVPIITVGVPVGTVLVGDFAHGDTLFRRASIRIVTGTGDSDLLMNRVCVLGESRCGNAVVVPQGFAKAVLA